VLKLKKIILAPKGLIFTSKSIYVRFFMGGDLGGTDPKDYTH
jgi:hypothetical protein